MNWLRHELMHHELHCGALTLSSRTIALDKNGKIEYNENTKKLPGNGHFIKLVKN